MTRPRRGTGHAAVGFAWRVRRRMLGLMLLGLVVASVSCARPRETDYGPALAQEAESVAVEVAPGAAAGVQTETSGPGLQAVGSFDRPGGESAGASFTSAPDAPAVEELLRHGLHIAGASPVHLAIRGTPAASSVRCAWRGIARTAQQRENAIRFWLQIQPDDAIPNVTVVETLFAVVLDSFNPEFLETAKANFLAIARGGLSLDYRFLTCFADYAVTNFLLGTGTTPTTVTVAYDRMDEAASYDLYVREHAAGTYGSDPLQPRGAYEAGLQAQVVAAEQALSDEIGGREAVVFLAPMGAHNAIGFEAWQAVASWAVVTDDANVVQAVRADTPAGDPEHTQPLAKLTSRITAAAAGDAHAATRVTTVGGLQSYYRTTLKAYDDITPGDGETTTFTPAQPPPAPTCANGTVIPNPAAHRALVKDCETLLAARDTLRGTAALNWATSTALSRWTGVRTGGTPTRVTGLHLAGQGLTGTLPTGLGRLFGLTTLNLSANRLSGDIPTALTWLVNLRELWLAGNALTGCLPPALPRVPTHDLGSLGLPGCGPPAPANLRAGAPVEASVALSWTSVPGASAYRVEYRLQGAAAWTLASDTLTATAHTVPDLQCGLVYEFQVRAYGDGTTHGAAWGDASAVLTAAAGACPSCDPLVVVSPTLTLGATTDARRAITAAWAYGDGCAGLGVTRHSLEWTYAYADGTRWSTALQAPGGSPRTWSVARTREGGRAPLTRLTWTALTLTGGPDGRPDVRVTFDEPPSLVFTPAAPTGVLAGPATATAVPLIWAAVTGAATYRVEARVKDTGPWTTDADTLTAAAHTVAGLTCATAYEFRVSAFGDGVTLAAAWGAPSTAVTATTGACPPPGGVTVAFAPAVSQLREGTSATVTVTLSSASARAVTIPLTVTPRTAAAGIPASVTIAAGATAASFQVTAVQDQLDEPTAEMLFLAFGELPAGLAAGQPARHLLVISDAPAG